MGQLTLKEKGVARAVLEGLLLTHAPTVSTQRRSAHEHKQNSFVPRIEGRIQVIRGLLVMIDVGLAALYVRRGNQAAG